MNVKIDRVSISRGNDGLISLEAAGFNFRFSEDDCTALAQGLTGVSINNPPACIVHMETSSRAAWVENTKVR